MTNLNDQDLSKVAAGGGSADFATNDNIVTRRPQITPKPGDGDGGGGGGIPIESENPPDDGGNMNPGPV